MRISSVPQLLLKVVHQLNSNKNGNKNRLKQKQKQILTVKVNARAVVKHSAEAIKSVADKINVSVWLKCCAIHIIIHIGMHTSKQWFAVHLEHWCKKKKQDYSIKNRPLHQKHSISLGVVCFRVYLSAIFDFLA